ncbi:MAG: hypothetical protein H7141_04385 [Burkholderiales bacterium]|nr:hypothetical protein [Bacteroidia bacterium]
MPLLTNILKRASKIEEDVRQLFVADQDFSYCGFPIKENSLVYYDGNDEVKINMQEYSLFGPLSVPTLMDTCLMKTDNFKYNTQQVGTCEKEDTVLKIGWRGIWHNNHFDKWNSSFDEYLERLQQMSPLEYQGILFSPLVYSFNPKSQVLCYFLSSNTVNVAANGYQITLPANVEISIDKGIITAVPFNKNHIINYHGIPVKGPMFTTEDGTLVGQIGEKMKFKIYDHQDLSSLTVATNDIEITKTGEVSIRLFDEKSSKIKKYRISPIDDL